MCVHIHIFKPIDKDRTRFSMDCQKMFKFTMKKYLQNGYQPFWFWDLTGVASNKQFPHFPGMADGSVEGQFSIIQMIMKASTNLYSPHVA